MIKVNFRKTDIELYSELSIYSPLNPIPFSLKMSKDYLLPNTIYTRNFSGENFIEFRFDKNTRILYEITLVAIQNDTVSIVDKIFIKKEKDKMFNCLIDEDSEFETSDPIHIIRDNSSLSLIWNKTTLNYFQINSNCILGVNDNSYLSAIILNDLNQKVLFEIFGY